MQLCTEGIRERQHAKLCPVSYSVVPDTAQPPSPCLDMEKCGVRSPLVWCALQAAALMGTTTVKLWDEMTFHHWPWSITSGPRRSSLSVLPYRASKMGVQVLLFLLVSWRNRHKGHSHLASWHLTCEMGITCCFCLKETPWGWTRAVKVRLRSETHWHAASRNALFVPLLTPVHLLAREKGGMQDRESLTFFHRLLLEKKSLFLFIAIIL